jgi:membrane-bound ClpP family serine protease
MWIIAGILLGIVVLAAILGFHVGPHSHALAGVAGILAAVWLVVMALEGHSSSVLWSLFTADLLVSAGIGTLAWKALSARRASPQPRIAPAHHGRALEGEEGVAVSALTPEGVVRVRGEQWTAVAANGSVPAGGKVRVLGVDGMKLEVWGDGEASTAAVAPTGSAPADVKSLFSLEEVNEEAAQ